MDYKLQLFPPSYQTLSRYFIHVIHTKSLVHSSFVNLKSSIKTFYSCYGYNVNMDHPSLKLITMSSKRTNNRDANKKEPLTPEHILQFDSLRDKQDPVQSTAYAAIVFGFFTALRKSNIAPPSVADYDPQKHLSRRDIVFNDSGFAVNLQWTKTLQDQSKSFSIPVAKPPPDSPLDPVAIVTEFFTSHPVRPSDPAFSFYDHQKLYVLTQSYLNKVIKDWAQALGLDPLNFSCHSIRRGSASLMAHSGVRTELLKCHGTWSSAAYQGYIDFTQSQKLSVTQDMYKAIKSGCYK